MLLFTGFLVNSGSRAAFGDETGLTNAFGQWYNTMHVFDTMRMWRNWQTHQP